MVWKGRKGECVNGVEGEEGRVCEWCVEGEEGGVYEWCVEGRGGWESV